MLMPVIKELQKIYEMNLIKMKGELDKPTLQLEILISSLLMESTNRKISEEKNTIIQIDLIDIYKTIHSVSAE